MDISVSHLNRRVALQVPPELPLGLVFIVGDVHNLQEDYPARPVAQLQLRDGDHVLDCLLPGRLLEETMLQEGHRVRVGGQLAFDAYAASYHLRVHHLEVLDRRVRDVAPQGLLRGLPGNKRQQSALAPPDLPHWVRQLAPPEIQRELGFEVDDGVEDGPETRDEREGGTPRKPTSGMTGVVSSTDAPGDLSPQMVSFLSQAMDSDLEVELTPEILKKYGVAKAKDATSGPDYERSGGRAQRGQPSGGETQQRRRRKQHRTDDLARSIASWLSNPQLYVIPLFMVLIFLTAIFIFVFFQQ